MRIPRVLTLFLTLTIVADATAAPAKLRIRTDQPGHAVPRTLWGVFFEEINRAGDGGLYAEMVQNRSFEDAENEPVAWTINQSGDGAKAEIDRSTPMKADTKFNKSALLVSLPKGGEARLVNEGFKGMAVRAAKQYQLTLMRRGGVDGMTFSLRSRDDKPLAEPAKIDKSDTWKKFEHRFTATADADDARLVIECKGAGEVAFDMISLMPRQRWKGMNLRADLAGMVDDLRPAFVRFPGGCWVEGETLAGAYRWKETIGDLAERRTQYNLWKYTSTHGLGFHEYLQLAENLGAEPLFVINCGMSHKEVAPLEQMGEWVQDALDAIEYASGGDETKWGAVRAKNGRKQPFNLKYIQIGNENGGKEYDERYALFYDAIKKQYPQVHIVANLWRGKPGSRPIEILDEHYYNNPGFFMANADRYDKYDRAKEKIYVGEYAVTQGCGQGNLVAALGEAAFMTGIERNSDIVVMASYAPLFANVDCKAWNPDAINFDATRAYGTPSYYVQQMFATSRPEVVLPLELFVSDVASKRVGGVGVGTWSTQAEFKDLKVTAGDKPIFESDFSKGVAGFGALDGDWKAADGAIRQAGDKEGAFAIVGDSAKWDGDYIYSLKARKLGGKEGFLIVFHRAADDTYAMWNVGGWGNKRHQIEVIDSGSKSQIGNPVEGSIEPDRWYDLRVETRGEQIKCVLDGKLVHEVTYPKRRPLYASAGAKGDEVIVKVVNVTDRSQETEIDVAGSGGANDAGWRIRVAGLTSAKPTDENSLDEPRKITPAERELIFAKPAFTHTFPPYSVTVMRMRRP
jgi:alpha-L-arabinofuranosidase